MVAPGDKVILHGEVIEVAHETAVITLTGGMANLVAAPVQYLEKVEEIPDKRTTKLAVEWTDE